VAAAVVVEVHAANRMDLNVDFQGLLIGIVIIIVCALLVWGMSFMLRERTFEDTLEQQHRAERELLQMDKHQATGHGKKDKDKQTNKKKNKKQLKAGDSPPSAPVPVLEKQMSESEISKKGTKMVELDIDPEVIETSLDEPVSASLSTATSSAAQNKKKKGAKTSPSVAAKPILINKEEKSVVRKADEAAEVIHHKKVPKDAVELKHDHDRRKSVESHEPLLDAGFNGFHSEGGHSKPTSEAAKHVSSKVVIVEPLATGGDTGAAKVAGSKGKKQQQHREQDQELTNGDVLVKTQVANVAAAAPPPSEQQQSKKKNNKTATPSANSSPDVERLFELAEVTTLDDTEVRRLVDILSGKLPSADAAALLGSHGEWNKKGQKDPTVILAKQLEDKKREVEEEKLRGHAAVEKNKELQLELADMRQKLANLVKQNSDQLTSQRQENAQLAARLQQQESNLAVMRAQLETMKTQLNESHNELQRTKAENMHLVSSAQQYVNSESMLEDMRQKVKIMDDALKSQSLKYNQCDNARKTLENNVKLYEDKISHLENSLVESQMMAQRYKEASAAAPEELHKLQLRNQSLIADIDHLTTSAQRIEKELLTRNEELKSSENRYHDVSRQKSEAEGRLRLADAQIHELHSSMQQKDMEIQALNATLNELRVEVARETVQKSANDVQEETLTKVEVLSTESKPMSDDISDLSSRLGSALSDAKTARDEAENLRQQLGDKLAELEDLKNAAAGETAGRSDVEIQAKDAEIAKLLAEIQELRRDNEVLHDCSQKCEDMKASLIALNDQLRAMEEDRVAVDKQLSDKQSAIAQLEADLAETNKNLDDVKSRFVEVESERVKIGQQLTERNAECDKLLSDKQSAIAQLEADLAETKKNLDDVKSRFVEVESERAKIGQQLTERNAECDRVLGQLQLKEQEAGAAVSSSGANDEEQLRRKDAEISELKSRLEAQQADFESRLKDTAGTASESSERLQQLEVKNETLTKELEQLGEQLAAAKRDREAVDEELSKSVSALNELRNSVTGDERLKADLEQRVQEVNDLRAELDQLRAANESLQKLVADMKAEAESQNSDSNAAETEQLRTQVERHTHEITRLNTLIETTTATHTTVLMKIRETITRILPGFTLEGNWQERSDWLAELEKRVSQPADTATAADANELAELQSQLEASRQEADKLQFQVQHYKTVLSDTESILKKLQDSVETEDQKSLQKLQLSEDQLSAAKDEVVKLREQMKTMHKTEECFVSIVGTPAVDRKESTLRKEGTPDKKTCSMSELCGDNDAAAV